MDPLWFEHRENHRYSLVNVLPLGYLPRAIDLIFEYWYQGKPVSWIKPGVRLISGVEFVMNGRVMDRIVASDLYNAFTHQQTPSNPPKTIRVERDPPYRPPPMRFKERLQKLKEQRTRKS
jgi:hypothetical protein